MPRIVVFTPREIRKHEDAFARLVGESLVDVARQAAAAIGGVVTAAAEPTPPPPQMPPPPPPVGPPAGVAAEDLAVISGLWAGQVSAILAPQVAESFADAATATAELLGGAFPDWPIPEVSNSFAEAYLASATNRLQGIGDALWEAARTSLLEGFAQGESIPELRDRVMAAANVSQARANVIARTEIIGASNAGSIQQVRVTGLVGTKEWLATNDERTRCTHRAADGQTVDLDGKFTLGGELECGDFGVALLDRPGDPLAPPSEIIQCRCSVAYDLDVPSDAEVDEADVPLVAATHAFHLPGKHNQADHGRKGKLKDAVKSAIPDGFDVSGMTGEGWSPDDPMVSAIAEHASRYGFTKIKTGAGGGVASFDAKDPTTLNIGPRDKWTDEYFTMQKGQLDGTYYMSNAGDDFVAYHTAHEGGHRLHNEKYGISNMDAAAKAVADWANGAGLQVVDPYGYSPPKPFSPDDVGLYPNAAAMQVLREQAGLSWYGSMNGQEMVAELHASYQMGGESGLINALADVMGWTRADPSVKTTEVKPSPGEGVVIAAAQVHTGAMIALRMAEVDARAMELDDYEDADELHVTLMYLGDAVNWSAENQRLIHEIVADVASRYEPIETETFSVNIFNPRSDEFDTAIVLGVKGNPTHLAELHRSLKLNVDDVFDEGDVVPKQHTPWIPHITLAYLDDQNTDLDFVLTEAMDRLGPVTFDRIRVAFAGEVADYQLGYDDREVLVAATEFVEADHVRDAEGKFAKKPGGKIVKTLTNAVIYGKHQDGDVIATSQDGSTVVKYDAKGNKIEINGKKVGKAEAYKQLKTKENWILGGAPGGNVAPPTVTKPKPKKIGSMNGMWPAIKNGEYDGMVVAEAHAADGKLISRYVVHGNGNDAIITQEIIEFDGTWSPYKKFTDEQQWNGKLVDLKHSSLTTKPVDPTPVKDPVPLDEFPSVAAPKKPTFKPSAPATPVSAPATPGVVNAYTKNNVKLAFKNGDVKWWTNASIMYPVAAKAAQDNNLTMAQVLAIMDETTKTKTSPTPFTDKINKYMKTKKGQDHVFQILGSKVGVALGTPPPSSTPKSHTSAPNVATLSFVPSTGQLKENGDFKILGVNGAHDLKAEMDKQYGDWTPSQRAALKKYTGSYYTEMNGCLRKPSTCTPAIIKTNENASAGMRPTTRDMKVTRGAGFAALGFNVGYGQMNSPDTLAKMQSLVGKTLVEPGFLSTSVTPSPAFGGAVHFEIDVPEGTKAAWLKPISNYSHENEMLLDAGLKYRVKEVLPPGNGHSNYLVKMEVVP